MKEIQKEKRPLRGDTFVRVLHWPDLSLVYNLANSNTHYILFLIPFPCFLLLLQLLFLQLCDLCLLTFLHFFQPLSLPLCLHLHFQPLLLHLHLSNLCLKLPLLCQLLLLYPLLPLLPPSTSSVVQAGYAMHLVYQTSSGCRGQGVDDSVDKRGSGVIILLFKLYNNQRKYWTGLIGSALRGRYCHILCWHQL